MLLTLCFLVVAPQPFAACNSQILAR
ncbi:hypothetical protein PENANT_c169G10166, partial [Penicillium antarcticum]